MSVLVLTHPLDVTTDLVILAVQERGLPVARFDLAAFPLELTLSAELSAGRWVGYLSDQHRRIELEAVSAVYYRRPSPFVMPAEMSDPERLWAAGEARHGVGGVLASLPCRWVNHPHDNAAASYKPRQLVVAAACGLTVPVTAVTNCPADAAAFVAGVGGAVYKPLYGSPDEPGWTMFTSRVDADRVGPDVAATAHQFQEYLTKDYEVRLTVVGDQVFAARIDAGSPAAALDWRTDYENISYRPVEVPSPVAVAVQKVMKVLGLRFGALDFVVNPEGQWIFLEINPNGQWGWIEQHTGQPIAAALAAELSGALVD